MKAVAAVDAMVYVGMIAISALMLAQLPGMINDVKTVLQNQAASEEMKTIQDIQTLASAAPGEITITHTPLGKDTSIQISKVSSPPPIVSNPEVAQAKLCERYNILDECKGIVGQGYCQWNWVKHDCFFFPSPFTTPDQCRDGIQNVDEAGRDCGGNRCVPCQVR